MVKFNDLLNLRLKSKEKQQPKMTALAELSKDGSLSSFSGVFKPETLNDTEKNTISDILKKFAEEENHSSFDLDFQNLIKITAEVKAITNQAVILHGERIKKAQQILKNYKEGAFSSWLNTTYGNRQTPYNFLQYYELYLSTPRDLHSKIDSMPRQAIYTLASRTGDLEKKQDIIKNYKGQSKKEVLSLIRQIFPLAQTDKRQPNVAISVINTLKSLKNNFSNRFFKPNSIQKEQIKTLIEELKKVLED